jgi:endonuclease/exonuclease/phosphatase family metal-dependent hydrolase
MREMNAHRILAALGLALALAALPVQAQTHEPLKVMSFNIRYGTANDGPNRWELRRDQLFDLLRDQVPDVIGLQEALHFQIVEILKAVPGYASLGSGRADGARAGEYAAILYRTNRLIAQRSDTFWFSDTPQDIASSSWGNRIERICTWAQFDDLRGGTFYVYNVHLDHESQPSREKSVALLLDTIERRRPVAPVVVTGDFNADEQNPATKAMLSQFRDTFRVKHPDAAGAGTFSGFKPDFTGDRKIDYVMVEPDTEVLDAAILRTARDGRHPSDHFPVVATIRLPQGPATEVRGGGASAPQDEGSR